MKMMMIDDDDNDDGGGGGGGGGNGAFQSDVFRARSKARPSPKILTARTGL